MVVLIVYIAAPRRDVVSDVLTIHRYMVCMCIFLKRNIKYLWDFLLYILLLQEGDFPWRYSLCGWTMASEQNVLMIVNDVTQDTRFCNNPVAKKYGVRFYVGAPLVSSGGHRIGTLCFADSKPRIFDDSSLKLLCNFSELVTRALEREIVLAHHKQVTKPGEALKELEHKHRYRMLLRSIDCVSRWVVQLQLRLGRTRGRAWSPLKILKGYKS